MPVLSIALAGGSPIDLDGTFFVQIAIFIVAFLVLRSFVFKPMVRVFDAREQAIEGTRKEAQELEASAQKQAAEFDVELGKVKATAGDERDRLRQEGLKLESTLLGKVRTDTQKLLSDADTRMAAEARRVRDDMNKDIPALAKQIASKLLGREVT